jgi:hypothetical protein
MKKTFTTHIKNKSENDQSIATDLIVTEQDGNVQITIQKETAELVRIGEVQTAKKESVNINEMDIQTLATIRNRMDHWIESDSKATVYETFPDCSGEYEVEDFQINTGRSWSKADVHPPNAVNSSQFETLYFSVGRDGIAFQFKQGEEFRGILIPSAEEINQIPQDIVNADLFNKTLFDFFNLRLPDEISDEVSEPASPEESAVARVERIFERFGDVARQLDERQRDRQPLLMEDEYDVQYLLHALLKIYFDDIRSETWTERHSSVSPRIDFLLERHDLGIEVKRASDSMSPKRIRSDLAEDKEQYRKDSNIGTLLCFIYDPEYQIKNPVEFETDLSESPSNLTTRVTITH